jgi:hypothetical protein
VIPAFFVCAPASVGRAHTTVHREVSAAEVSSVTNVGHDLSEQFQTLVEIHAAPGWLWSALVTAMVDGEWSVEQTRKKIAALGLRRGAGVGGGEGLEARGR